MKKLFTFFAITFTAAILMFISGCSGGSGGSSYNTSIPDFNNPGGGGGSSSSSATYAKGYVYYTGTAKGGNNFNLFFSPTQLSGFTPASGALITLQTNPPMQTRAGSNGFFDFKVEPDFFANQRIQLLIEFLDYILMQPVMPVKPIDQISMPRIMSSNSNGRDMSIATANSSTTLMLTDLFGNQVSESVTWVLSDSAMGSLSGSVFTAGNINMQGTISAVVNGKTVAAQMVTIITNTDAFFGNIKYSNNQNAADLIVTIKGFGINYSAYGVSDINGNYRIENVPNGYNYTLELTDKAGNLISYTRANNNPNPPHNLIANQATPQTATLMLKTVSDKLSYKPGDTIQARIEISNMSASQITITDRSVTYTLVEEDFFTGTGTKIAEASGNTGNLTIPKNSKASSLTTTLLIPSNLTINPLKSYVIKANVSGITFTYTFNTSLIISNNLTPGGGGGTPSTPPSTDKEILSTSYSQLSDAYWILNDATNRAESGTDVSYDVNSSSILVFKLELVRDNTLFNYSNTTLKNNWKNKINSIRSNLSRYVDTKDVYYLKEARKDLNSLKNDVKYQRDLL